MGQAAEAIYADGMVAYTQGLYAEAAQTLQQALSANPGLTDAYLGLGLVYERLGRYEEGIEAVQKYLAAYPHDMAARYALGRMKQRLEAISP